jgi:hypothetical protein
MLKRISATMAACLTVVIVLSALNVSGPVTVGIGVGVGSLVSVLVGLRQGSRTSTWGIAILTGLLIGGMSGALVRWLW